MDEFKLFHYKIVQSDTDVAHSTAYGSKLPPIENNCMSSESKALLKHRGLLNYNP